MGHDDSAAPSSIDARIQAAIERLGPLPVLDRTVRQICALADDAGSSAEELIATIENDEGFAANLLRFANSAVVARPIRSKTIRQALVLVGRRRLGQLALETATYRYLERASGNGKTSRGQLHAHAVAVAACASAAAERSGASIETAHLAGLLHDVGKLVLPLVFGEAAVEEISLAYPSGARRAAAERAAFGVDHAHVGAMYAGGSALPEDVYDAIAFHHGGASGDEVPSREAACVQLADQVVCMMAGAEPDLGLLGAALAMLGLSESFLDELAEQAAPQPTPLASPLADRVQELERIAFVDALTGVSSRRAWLERVQERITGGATGSVMICDVDRLKQVNDTHGHASGDRVLIATARVLARHGFAGRLGGDEFALWFDGGANDAEQVARSIVEDAEKSTTGTAAQSGGTSVSIGIAEAPRHGTDVGDLLAIADAALYEAKAAGRRRARIAA